MRRYVRRVSRGIALVDTSSDQPKLRYVFDVSDTSGGENSRRPYLWEYRQEHREVVSAALEQRFDVSGENGLTDQMERVAAQLVDEYWHDNRHDIVGIVDGSFLESYDDFNIGAAFRNAAVVSTTYALLSRCGMQPGISSRRFSVDCNNSLCFLSNSPNFSRWISLKERLPPQFYQWLTALINVFPAW